MLATELRDMIKADLAAARGVEATSVEFRSKKESSADMSDVDRDRTVSGVTYPFGSRSDGAYPYSVKIIEWEDLGRWGLQYWKMRIKFSEVV